MRCSQVRAASELHFGALREVAVRERQGALSRRAGNALLGRYAPDSARLEGSSIVDEQGECLTPVRDYQGVNREISEGKADF